MFTLAFNLFALSLPASSLGSAGAAASAALFHVSAHALKTGLGLVIVWGVLEFFGKVRDAIMEMFK
jgi:hypothetical protein